MTNLRLADVTLRESTAAQNQSINFKERIEIARLLDQLGMDTVEFAAIQELQQDTLLLKSVAGILGNSWLALAVVPTEEGVDQAWSAIKDAAKPRLQVQLPLSTVKMEYELHKKPAVVLELVKMLVTRARTLCPDVEFIADDATRAEQPFLEAAVRAAIEAGAGLITFSDRSGSSLPPEFAAFIRKQFEAVEELSQVTVGVQCFSEVNLAESCALASVESGASVIKVCATGEGQVDLAHLVRLGRLRNDLPLSKGLAATEADRAAARIRMFTSGDTERRSPAAVSAGGGSDDSGDSLDAVFTVEDSAETINAAVRRLGYLLSAEDQNTVYDAFKHIAAGKPVSLRELDVIVAENSLRVTPTYTLENYMVTASSGSGAFCQVRLGRNDEVLEGLGSGNGPIDAAFTAIERIIGHHYELDDFQVKAITEGHEAMGASLVRLRSDGMLYSGTGVSTDIIGSSIRAYVNALNKISNENRR